MTTRLTGTGIWSGSLRYGDPAEAADRAAELEALAPLDVALPETPQ